MKYLRGFRVRDETSLPGRVSFTDRVTGERLPEIHKDQQVAGSKGLLPSLFWVLGYPGTNDSETNSISTLVPMAGTAFPGSSFSSALLETVSTKYVAAQHPVHSGDNVDKTIDCGNERATKSTTTTLKHDEVATRQADLTSPSTEHPTSAWHATNTKAAVAAMKLVGDDLNGASTASTSGSSAGGQHARSEVDAGSASWRSAATIDCGNEPTTKWTTAPQKHDQVATNEADSASPSTEHPTSAWNETETTTVVAATELVGDEVIGASTASVSSSSAGSQAVAENPRSEIDAWSAYWRSAVRGAIVEQNSVGALDEQPIALTTL